MPSSFFFFFLPTLSLMSSLFKPRKHFPGKEKLNENYFSLGAYPEKKGGGASQVSYSAIENSGESEAEI